MTPQELDVSMKDIRHMRNMSIFISFVPIIYLLVFGVIAFFIPIDTSFTVTIRMMLSITTLLIVSFLTFWIIKPNRHHNRMTKVGVAAYSFGLLFLNMLFWVPSLIDLSLVAILLFLVGLLIYAIKVNMDWYVKSVHLIYVIIMVLFAMEIIFYYGRSLFVGLFSIATLVYPMFISYLSVRWAGKEFFKLMGNEK